MCKSILNADELAACTGVSRETLDCLIQMDNILLDWNSRHNLVSRSSMPDRWNRHYLDSAQIAACLPEGIKTLYDFGSGAGFPGLVLAIMLREDNVSVTLVECTGKKAAFLEEVVRKTGLRNVRIMPERIESVSLKMAPCAITARALAPLEKLIQYVHAFQGKKTRTFLLKGRNVNQELLEAGKSWDMHVKKHKSITAPDAFLLELSGICPKQKSSGAEPD